jgi:hypothetical protein
MQNVATNAMIAVPAKRSRRIESEGAKEWRAVSARQA